MNIEFTCANCGAGLKVLQTFAGKTIQCPKCTKKTLVPAAGGESAPAAAKPAPVAKPVSAAAKPAPVADAKPPAMDGIYISFACGNCAAALKVLKSFAGKSIQCPKCAKKTAVPGGTPKEEAAAPAPATTPVPATAASEPAVVPPPEPPKAAEILPPVATAPAKPVAAAPAPKAEPAPVPKVEPPAPKVEAPVPAPVQPVDTVQPKLREQEQKIEALTRQMRDLELRLDVERLKAEKAEQEKQALAGRKADERLRLQEELSVHFKAEVEAARQTITRLEDKVREATEQRLATPAPGARSAAQIEKELLQNPDETMMEAETAVPDAVMAQIRDSRFGRYLRTAIVIHAVLLGVTSIGLIRGYFVKPPPEGADGAGTNTVTAVSAPASEAAPAAPAAPAAAVAEPGPAASAEKPADKPAAAGPLEVLPAAGEKPPTETQVDLGL
jgi:DNA-directed RNA polymerase subunit RPC12/RpoP